MANGSWDPGSLASLGPLLTLLAPHARSISRRYRIQSNAQFCDLLRRRREALEQLDDPETEKWPGLRDRLSHLVRDIDRELTSMEWHDDAFRLFVLIAAGELLLFSGAVFSGVWHLRAIIVAKTWKSGIPFFEGIFASPEARIALFMVAVGIAALLMKRLASRVESRVTNNIRRVLAYLGLFNLLLALVIGAIFQILVLTDPISPYW